MTTYNPKQQYLIPHEAVFGLKPLRKYELLFETLESCLAGCFPSRIKGRPPVSKDALLNALIYKNVRQLPTLFDVTSTVIYNPCLATQPVASRQTKVSIAWMKDCPLFWKISAIGFCKPSDSISSINSLRSKRSPVISYL